MIAAPAIAALHGAAGNGSPFFRRPVILQVVGANYGLRSLEQAPLMRQLISSEESVGDLAEACELEQELLALVERHPDDLRIVPILQEIGDKRMELFCSHLAGERPPQVILGCFCAFLPDMLAPERARGATGYVDVELDVTRYGTTRRIEILDTRNASLAAEHEISRRLVDNRFRPKMTDTGPVDAHFVVRHYVHE